MMRSFVIFHCCTIQLEKTLRATIRHVRKQHVHQLHSERCLMKFQRTLQQQLEILGVMCKCATETQKGL